MNRKEKAVMRYDNDRIWERFQKKFNGNMNISEILKNDEGEVSDFISKKAKELKVDKRALEEAKKAKKKAIDKKQVIRKDEQDSN